MARTYTDAQKAEAVALTLEHGPTEAGAKLGIPKSTCAQWLTPEQKAEMAARSVSKTRAATAAHALSLERKRAELRGLFADAARHHVERSLVTDDGKDAQHWMTAGAIGLDKLRLELGEATDRTEHRTVDQVTAEVERLAAEMTRVDEATVVDS